MIAPLLAVIVILLIGSSFGLLKLTSAQDERQLADSRYFAAQLLDDLQSSLRRTLRDNADWRATYEHLHVKFDIDWAFMQRNLGPNLYRELGIDLLMLFNPNGEEIYTVERGVMTQPVAHEIHGDLTALVHEARLDPEGTKRLSGKGTFGGDPVLIAASPITPGGDASLRRFDDVPSVLVMVKRLDAPTVAEAGGRVLLANLRIVKPADVGATSAVLPFASADGSVALALAWDPERPGAEIVAQVRPWLLLALIVVGAVGALLVRHGLATAEKLEETSTRLICANRQAEFQAQHDDTTGLPNRQKLARFVDTALDIGEPVALLFLDLDRFKPVNDAFGHETGDRVLRVIAERILCDIPPRSLVARVGGDEFVVATPQSDRAEILALAERLAATMTAPIRMETAEIVVGVSVGIAIGPDDADEFGELMRHADIALYEAKKDGRGGHRFFAPHMNDHILRRKGLEADLRLAIERGELELYFQPRLIVAGGRQDIVGAEALLRWFHPVHGSISPVEFIPIAEETGQIGAIGAWVLETACRAAVAWPDITVSVNVSPVQFRYDRLASLVAEALERTGLPPHHLELEITESALFDDRDKAAEVCLDLKQLGVGLAIDDFGSGYSSLNYLRQFPFDKIKLDRTFIADLAPSSETRAIVRTVIDLGRALGMTVVAEGVETWDQLLLLRLELCPEVQGYLTGRPMPATDFAARLADERATVEPAVHSRGVIVSIA